MAEAQITIDGVCKVFGQAPAKALELVRGGMSKADLLARTGHVLGLYDVNLSIQAGETFVIMGLSGSGKSTLIRHFNRLIEPTAGRIIVDGRNILRLSEPELRDFRRHKIAMVFQRFALLPHRSVLENIMFGLLVDGMPRAMAEERARYQLSVVGLDGFEGSYPAQLSGGMQQRVGLARALATDADILLMDEAFSALDPLIRHDMQLQLKDIQAKLKKTIIFITHDLDEALLLGDHIAILRDGIVRQVGTGPDILNAPADDYVARFVHDVNRARFLTCGQFTDRDVRVDSAGQVDAKSPIETAFAAFAQGGEVVSVVNGNGQPIGALSLRRVMQALARH